MLPPYGDAVSERTSNFKLCVSADFGRNQYFLRQRADYMQHNEAGEDENEKILLLVENCG
jgi:hypothetical protein